MAKGRRLRVSLDPVDGAALETIAALVRADAAASALFDGFYARAPTSLAPLLGEERRAWLIRADAEPAGFLDADLIDGCLHLSFFVVEALRRRGIAKAAVGQLLGSAPFPRTARLRIIADPGNDASAGVARSTGFARSGTSESGGDVWERAAVPERRSGPARFLRADGRIDRLPLRAPDRVELLTWVADRVLSPGEVLTERELGERLALLTEDIAGLRRALVDHELVERTRTGSEYARVTDATLA